MSIDVAPALEEGRHARKRGCLTSALAAFQQAAARCGTNATPHIEIGRTFLLLGQPWEAADHLAEALALEPDSLEALRESARCAAALGQQDRALAEYAAVLHRNPTDVEAFEGAAELLVRRDRFRDVDALASVELLEAARGHPAGPRILALRALASLGLKQDGDALQLMADALRLARGVWPLAVAVDYFAARGSLDVLEDFLRNLRPDALEAVGDWIGYDQYLHALAERRSFTNQVARQAQLEGVDLRDVTPVGPESCGRPRPFADGHLSTSGVYFQVARLLPAHDAPVLPADVDSLTSDDRAAISHWPAVRQQETTHLTYVFDDCWVSDALFGQPLVITDDDSFARGLVAPLSMINLARRVPRPTSSRDSSVDEVFVLPYTATFWRNYYHGMIELMSCLSIYMDLGRSCALVVPHTLPRLHYEIFDAVGVAREKLIHARDVRGSRIRRAYCPEASGGQRARMWWRSVATEVSGEVHRERKEIIYLARDRAVGKTARPLVNETELMALLSDQFNARIVHSDELPFAEQVRIAAKAGVVIGPHGAGLTNMIFAESGAWIVELFPEKFLRHWFRDLAAVAGHGFVPVVGTVVDAETMQWRVDLGKVARVVELLLQ